MGTKMLWMISACLFLALYAGKARCQYHFKTLVIDAGHGGNKPGARGKQSLEKNIALAVALKLGSMVKSAMPGVNIIYTRTTDRDVDFLTRAAKATRNHADLFISIHCNSEPGGGEGMGTETYVAGSHRLHEQDMAVRENADIIKEKNYKQKYGGYDLANPASLLITGLYKNHFRAESLRFAKILQGEYAKSGRHSRGIKEQGILILQRCGTPAVLTEIGFISNRAEEAFMLSKAGQEKIAGALCEAVRTYKRVTENQLQRRLLPD